MATNIYNDPYLQLDHTTAGTEPGTRFVAPTDPNQQQVQPTTNPFDPKQQVGHDGSINGLTREQYRDKWMSSGVNSVDGAKNWLSQYGGTWLSDNGTVLTPFGEQLDMLINARGSAAGSGVASAGWGGTGGGTAPATTPSTTPVSSSVMTGMLDRPMPVPTTTGQTGGATSVQLPAGARYMEGHDPSNPNALVVLANGQVLPQSHPMFQQAAGQAPGGGTAPGAVGADGLPADNKAALMQLLRQRMTQDLEIDPNDPVIKNQVDQFGASQERQRKQYLNEAAEQASARGLGSSGALENERRMSNEKAGIATSGFQAELMGRELVSRRSEIQNALDSMGNLLTESERQALQRELNAADNTIRRYGIDTQNSQYFAGLGQADRHFYDQLSQADRLAGDDNAFRYAQLGQSDSQFRDQLGFNMADRQAYWDAVRRGIA